MTGQMVVHEVKMKFTTTGLLAGEQVAQGNRATGLVLQADVGNGVVRLGDAEGGRLHHGAVRGMRVGGVVALRRRAQKQARHGGPCRRRGGLRPRRH